MKRAYIAGAYSAPDVLTLMDNMRRGIRLAAETQAAGFAVYVPWEDIQRHLMHSEGFTMGTCYAASMAWLEVSDAVLVQPVRVKQSRGTQAEIARANALGIPVFWSLEELEKWRDEEVTSMDTMIDYGDPPVDQHPGVVQPPAPVTAEEHYWRIHDEIRELHKRKGADYGEDQDPMANLRAAEAFGLPAWKGVALRMEDKMRRIRTFCRKGELQNESLEDSFLDMANYAMLGLALLREGKGK